jgi:hypothetical protein
MEERDNRSGRLKKCYATKHNDQKRLQMKSTEEIDIGETLTLQSVLHILVSILSQYLNVQIQVSQFDPIANSREIQFDEEIDTFQNNLSQ